MTLPGPLRRLLRDSPIERKLTVMMLLTTGLALLLACVTFVVYEQREFREGLLADLDTAARMVGHNSAAALSFSDRQDAELTLRSLSAMPNVVSAALYDDNDRLFGTYRRSGSSEDLTFPLSSLPGNWQRFGNNSLQVFRGIEVAGERTGSIYIRSTLDEMHERLRRYLLVTLGVLAAATVVAFLLAMQLKGIVADPVSHLAAVVSQVSRDKNYTVRATKSGNDELGRLIDGFNEMLDQIQARDAALEDARGGLERRVLERTAELQQEIAERKRAEAELAKSHQQLMEASRQSGMAEVATNVLHNVGNVLNSVNVSASLVLETIKASRATSLAKVVALLREHQADLGSYITADDKGRHIPGFLEQLSNELRAQQQALVQEMESLRGNIDHIKGIVAMQQGYAKVSGATEVVDLKALVEDSLRMTEGAIGNLQVQIVRELEDVPLISVEKHKVLQILINLVRNAKQACASLEVGQRRITVRLGQANGRIRMTVADNGVGIAPENLTRIFAHGFTTRKDGHGFGLHSGALAAAEMGGSLLAQSDGIGKGATFTLELPVQRSRA